MRAALRSSLLALAIIVPATGCGAGVSAVTPGPTGPSLDDIARQCEANARRIAELEQALDARDQRVRDLERAQRERDAKLEEIGATLDSLGKRQGTDMQAVEQDVARTGGQVTDLKRSLDEVRRIIDALRTNSLVPNAEKDVPRIDARVVQVLQVAGGTPTILIDKGARQGVKPAFEFTVARAGKSFAKIVIDQVDPAFAGGHVVYQKDGEAVREGDTASTRAQ